MPRFSGFVKGWIARTFPELMPKGSLQRCQDLNFSVEGVLRSSRELVEVVDPTGVSHASDQVLGFYQVDSGSSEFTYIVRSNLIQRDINNNGFSTIYGLNDDVFDYTTATKLDSGSGTLTVTSTGVTCLDIRGGNPLQLRMYLSRTIPSDFRFDYDFRISGVTARYSHSTGVTYAAAQVIFSIAEITLPYLDDSNDLALSVVSLSSGTTPTDGSSVFRIRLVHNRGGDGDVQLSSALSGMTRNTDYYASTILDSTVGDYGVFKTKIYTDSGRTSLLGEVSLTLQSSTGTYKYLIPTCSPDKTDSLTNVSFGSNATYWKGRVRNLTEKASTVGSISSFDVAVMTPTPSTEKVVYMASSSGLLRDTGRSKFTSGSSWVQVGLPTPSGMSSAVLGGGSLSGTYKTAYSYYDSAVGAESELSGISTLVCSNSKIKVKWSTASGDTGHADQVKIYRTIAGGGTLYLQGTVNIDRSAATGTSTSGITDASLGATAPDAGKPPSNSTLCEAWLGRLWLSGVTYFDGAATTNRVWYSRNLLPETVPPDYYLAVPKTDSTVKGLAIFEGSLYVITESSIYEVEGRTSNSFKLSDELSPVGAASSRSIAVGREGIFFVGRDGIYLFRFRSLEVSNLIKWLFDEVDSKWNTRLSSSQIDASKGEYWDGEYYVTVGGDTYVYDAESSRWRSRTIGFTSLWVNPKTQFFYAGASIPSVAHQAVYRISNDGVTGVSGAYSPDFITRPEPMVQAQDQNGPIGIGHVSRYKVYCKGYWTFYFYCDESLVHTTTGTTYTGASRSVIYNLPSDIKGTMMYVRGVASNTGVTPGSTQFYSMEVF